MHAFRYAMATISLLYVAAHGRPTRQFDQTGSTWYEAVQEIIQSKCGVEFEDYKHGHSPNVTQKTRVSVLINCILTQMSDFYKVNMAASSIVLGSAPMILQSLGSTTAETALLGLRRPILSFLLATGSPAVTTVKGSEFIEMLARFVRGGETRNLGMPGFHWSGIHMGLRPVVSLSEYLLVGVAATNVVLEAHRLGTRAIVVFVPTTTWLPSLWTLIAVLIHGGGTIALHLRVRVYKPPPPPGPAAGGFASWVPDELIPSAFQRPSRMAWRREHVAYYALSWFLSICTVAHVVFGTLIFSSLLFFSVRDATKVVARYAASAIICRAVVRFELAGLTEATTYGDDGPPPESTEALDEEVTMSLDEAKDSRGNG
ncbi:hypothetical protein HRG_006910 [Hirsutella rhossiliensis]|uniref:Uncharacterized protein n=1 Tax=Hirsutella rhossiliensis TaxID=111463 RepID=A0A9P8MV69_9HYPO|nr:uncharacterized protein HRG_06910 [Hirsutella rhossiliensis]KAH0961830.1 hypothetical protein HRG_06910 [Hirsutella rhossiliensis]